MVLALLDSGHTVVVLDNLSLGHREAVPPDAQLIIGDLLDAPLVSEVLADGPWDGVFHFAALSLVGESMRAPFHYLDQNVRGGLNLIRACAESSVKRFVLSSTANLFGVPNALPISEEADIRPHSPYGESKRMLEEMLRWADEIYGMRSACLRYFNAAGADPFGRAGEDHDPETHIVPLAIDSALGRREPFAIYGTDYDTPDGTCIRDYVHVTDLAQAHLAVLPCLESRSVKFNIGNGFGFSVRQVLDTVAAVTSMRLASAEQPRRPGDPPALIACSDALRKETGWSPRFEKLHDIVRTAYEWRLSHPFGYGTGPRPPENGRQS